MSMRSPDRSVLCPMSSRPAAPKQPWRAALLHLRSARRNNGGTYCSAKAARPARLAQWIAKVPASPLRAGLTERSRPPSAPGTCRPPDG